MIQTERWFSSNDKKRICDYMKIKSFIFEFSFIYVNILLKFSAAANDSIIDWPLDYYFI